MTTSLQELDFYRDNDGVLGEAEKAYFRARFRERAFSALLEKFYESEKDTGLLRATIAKRLGKHRSQVTRWLTEPSNLTLDALSDLLLALGSEPTIEVRNIGEEPIGNYYHPASTQGPSQPRTAPRVTTSQAAHSLPGVVELKLSTTGNSRPSPTQTTPEIRVLSRVE